MYIELHAASAFSFLQGASLPETLVERAAALGYPALALLDADGVYGAPRFHKAAKQAGLKAIIGAELTIELPGPRFQSPTARSRSPAQSPIPTSRLTIPNPMAISRCSSPRRRATAISVASSRA